MLFLVLLLGGTAAATVYLTAISKKPGPALSKLSPEMLRAATAYAPLVMAAEIPATTSAPTTSAAAMAADAAREAAIRARIAHAIASISHKGTFNPPPPPPPPPVTHGPVRLPPGDLLLEPGRRYLAVVDSDVPFTTSGAIRKAARGEGFTNIDYVSEDGPPAGWISWKQGLGRGDWYIAATYSGARRTAPRRPNALVQIVDAWVMT